MLSRRSRSLTLAATLFALTAVVPLYAQQNTTATYGDWVVRCVVQSNNNQQQKLCEMDQTTEVQGKNAPLSREAIPRPEKGKPLKFIVQLPVNVWLPPGLRIQMNDKDPGIAASYTHCVPGGCFAEVELNDDTVRKFRLTTTPGRILFKNAAQRDVVIPLSFNGFGQALDALSRS